MALGAAVSLGLIFGCADQPAVQTLPNMTVLIYNNDPKYVIYPVYEVSNLGVDHWMQGWFKIPNDPTVLEKHPYERTFNYRFYVNPTKGIQPGAPPATLVLPLFTQLAPEIDPKGKEQLIEWWNGGRIYLFLAPKAPNPDDQQPPAALKALSNCNGCAGWKSQTLLDLSKAPKPQNLPTCKGCESFKFYQDTAVLGNNEPAQVIEFSLGAAYPNAAGTYMVLVKNIVDIDVSYVDAAFLPVALAPYNPDLPDIAQMGYIGSVMGIDDFRARLTRWRKNAGTGWPVFKSRQGNAIPKIPSPVNLFARDEKKAQPDLTPNPPWAPLKAMREQWQRCVTQTTDVSTFCIYVRDVADLFWANYLNYRKIFDAKKCDKTKKVTLSDKSDPLMVAHVYGFTPFVEGCQPTDNLLENTPGYVDDKYKKFRFVKDQRFDPLMKRMSSTSGPTPGLPFNPYVSFIHDEYNPPAKKFNLGITNAYAYSVDDALGNLEVEGVGMVIAIGGKRGLPNSDPVEPPINVTLGNSPKQKVNFAYYGICTLDPQRAVNQDSPAFAVSIQQGKLDDCPISLKDDNGLIYTFKLKQQPPFATDSSAFSPKTASYIDCSGNKKDTPQAK